MQDKQQEREPELRFYNLPLSRLLAWNRWWHLTARVIVLVYKKIWGVVGAYRKTKKGIVAVRLTLLRANWSARGRERDAIKHST